MKNPLALAILASLLGLAVAAPAQTAGPKTGLPPVAPVGVKAHKGNHRLMKAQHEMMLAKLSLTPAQKAKIDAHDREAQTERKLLAKGDGAPKGAGKSEATKEKLKALKKANREFYKETLTKDQLREMKAMRRAARLQAARPN